jgi:hypothetical protein
VTNIQDEDFAYQPATKGKLSRVVPGDYMFKQYCVKQSMGFTLHCYCVYLYVCKRLLA